MVIFENRRLFNDLLIQEVALDFPSYNALNILDFGCGDGYLLKSFKKRYPSSDCLCVEKDLKHVINLSNVCNVLDYESFKREHERFINYFHIISLVDVVYMIPKQELFILFERFYQMLRSEGVIYIYLGIYAESKGVFLFKEILDSIKKENKLTEFLSLQELLSIFLQKNFNVYIKRLNLSSIFGLRVDKFIVDNLKDYIDYIYNDKLLIKLTKS